MSVSADPFADFIDQHPAAIRAVCWHERLLPDAAPLRGHLEIETKHGQVAVIDHRSGTVYRCPPRPPDADEDANQTPSRRHWRDLTRLLPGAFDDRPRFSRIHPLIGSNGRAIGWRFELTTGRAFEFHLHPEHPVLSTDSRARTKPP